MDFHLEVSLDSEDKVAGSRALEVEVILLQALVLEETEEECPAFLSNLKRVNYDSIFKKI